MKAARSQSPAASRKARTGMTGFDELTGGGLPQRRTTLLVGGPGSGKTIFSLQFLVHGARHEKEPGIFVAFEEDPRHIVTNLQGFDWNLAELQLKKLYFLNAQPTPDLVQTGDFDLNGMCAALGAKARSMGARRIVFDALDIVLSLLPNDAARRREMYRLHEWLLASGLTGIVTAKAANDERHGQQSQRFDFMQFMVDCAVMLNHRVVLGVSQRNLRVQKYRGSAFDENESPFVIGKNGFEVAIAPAPNRADSRVTKERVTSGVARLDTLLGGGYYRAASVLITGAPGTAKTTLSGAFAEGACRRSERTMFVSFESDASELIRNLTSVGIRLGRFVKSGCLRMVSARNITGSAETRLMRIKSLATEHRTRCLVIDPISALSSPGNELTANGVVERLLDWSKADGITLVCTSLIDETSSGNTVRSPLQVSTLADTWIHLSYLVQAGERNRGMSVIKSRGTAHSNQVRELILSDAGVTLADIYTAGGDVLMGTLRWEKESAERRAIEVADLEGELKRVRLVAEEAELEVRLRSVQTELVAKRVEKTLLTRTVAIRKGQLHKGHSRLRELRGGESIRPARKRSPK